MKLTGWYQGDQKPERKGIYERNYESESKWYCYWTGEAFCIPDTTPKGADIYAYCLSDYQNLPWCGVAK